MRIAQNRVETFIKLGEELGVKGLVRSLAQDITYQEIVEEKNVVLDEEMGQSQNFLEYDALVEQTKG